MAASSPQTAALADLISSTLNLLSQFAAFLNPNTQLPLEISIANPPNPLHILRDSATLVKAHVTKISLLAINKPFTPSAIRKVLNELAATCLPAMMSAVQICEQEKDKWSEMLSREVQARTRRVFSEMTTLLEEVRAVAQGDHDGRRRESLRSTGVVWESCDAVIELGKLGVAGLAVQKAQQYRDTIKDAIEELREWKEGEDLESEGHDALLDSDDEGVEGDRESVEDLFHAANSMPKDRPGLRALVEEADGKLKKVVLLYTALIKRRLRTFDVLENEEEEEQQEWKRDRLAAVKRLDSVMASLNSIPHQVDELAGCFYDLDEERVKGMLKSCIEEAKHAALTADTGWRGADDEFTAWSKKWHDAIS